MSRGMQRPVTLHTIERFMRITGMGPTRFGRLSVNDTGLLPDLRRGGELGPKREPRVAQFLKDHVKQQKAMTEKLTAFISGKDEA